MGLKKRVKATLQGLRRRWRRWRGGGVVLQAGDLERALVVYKKPIPNRGYVIGVDICEGISVSYSLGAQDPDYSVAQVLDATNGEPVEGRERPAQ